MIASKPYERLFLQNDGAQNIFVDLLDPLPFHQIEGIRFLFKLYTKKTPGAILNDPSGYGKCLQIVLFLNALRPLFKKPVLILSNSVDNWKYHFERWTDLTDDLLVEPSNLFFKKLICVSPIKDGVPFSRRAWGVVVLHDEYATDELLKMNFNADFKIWVTSDNLKENLHSLASIYEWLHPNQKFNVNQFTANTNSWRDVVEKALLLDTFVEDFLIRRNDFLVPFKKPENHKSTPPNIPSPVKATRKNKDPTGKKVKRSKKLVEMVTDDDRGHNNINETIISNYNEISKTSNNEVTNNISIPNNNDMDVEKFILNENPMESGGFDFVQDGNEASEESVTINMNLSESLDINCFKNINNTVANENPVEDVLDSQNRDADSPSINEQTQGNVATENGCTVANDCNNENSLVTHNNISNILQHLENKASLKNKTQIAKETENQVFKSNIIVPATEESSEFQSDCENKNKGEKSDDVVENYFTVTGVVIPETNTETENDFKNNDLKRDNLTESFESHKNKAEKSDDVVENDVTVTGVVIPETNTETENIFKNNLKRDDTTESFESQDWAIEVDIKNENPFENENGDNSKIIDSNGSNNVDNTDVNRTDEVAKAKRKIDDLDAQLAEYQAKALKMYKGSILDRLF